MADGNASSSTTGEVSSKAGASEEPLIISQEEKDVFLPNLEGNGSVTRDDPKGVVLTMDACFKSFDKDE